MTCTFTFLSFKLKVRIYWRSEMFYTLYLLLNALYTVFLIAFTCTHHSNANPFGVQLHFVTFVGMSINLPFITITREASVANEQMSVERRQQRTIIINPFAFMHQSYMDNLYLYLLSLSPSFSKIEEKEYLDVSIIRKGVIVSIFNRKLRMIQCKSYSPNLLDHISWWCYLNRFIYNDRINNFKICSASETMCFFNTFSLYRDNMWWF